MDMSAWTPKGGTVLAYLPDWTNPRNAMLGSLISRPRHVDSQTKDSPRFSARTHALGSKEGGSIAIPYGWTNRGTL